MGVVRKSKQKKNLKGDSAKERQQTVEKKYSKWDKTWIGHLKKKKNKKDKEGNKMKNTLKARQCKKQK